MSNEIEVLITSKDQTSSGFKSASSGARDVGASFDKVGESADGAEGKAQGFSDTLTGTKDIMGGAAEIAKGNLFEGFVQVGQGAADLAGGLASFVIPAVKNLTTGMLKSAASTAKNAVATVASTTASIAAATAQKAMAAAQWLLNAAMSANPIGIVVLALVALVAGIVIAYKKSETFRNIVNEAFSSVGQAILTMASIGLRGVRILLDGFLTMVGGILNAVAKIPGPTQDAAKKAADGFNKFKEGTVKALDGAILKVDQWGTSLRNMPKVARLQGDITDLDAKLNSARNALKDPKLTATKRAKLQADIADLLAKKKQAQDAINALRGKTVVIKYSSTGVNLTTPSSAGRNAHGGIWGGGPTWVGEDGPELADLPPGTQIHSNDTSKSMSNGAGGSGASLEEAAMMLASAVMRMLDENNRAITRAVGAGSY